MSSIFEYLEAVMKHWGPLLFGVFGSSPWWIRYLLSPKWQNIFDEYFNPSAMKWLGIICIITSFVCANYLAWKDQKDQNIELLSKLESITKPKLIGQIDGIYSGFTPEFNSVQLFICVAIKNAGAPSIAEGWLLSINNTEIELKDIMPVYIPEGYKLSGQKDEVIAEFHRNNALEENLLNPITQGSIKRGWLRYILKDVNLKQFRLPGEIIISFRDYLEQPYVIKKTITGLGGEYYYYPGGGIPIKPNVK